MKEKKLVMNWKVMISGLSTIILVCTSCFSREDKDLYCYLEWGDEILILSDSNYCFTQINIYLANDIMGDHFYELYNSECANKINLNVKSMSLKRLLRQGGIGSEIKALVQNRSITDQKLVPLTYKYSYIHGDTINKRVSFRREWH